MGRPDEVRMAGPDEARMAGFRVLGAAAFASAFDRFVVPPLLLAVAASFGTSIGQAAAILTAYLLVSALLQLPWGVVADSIGHRRALRLACFGAAAGGIACACAPSFGALVAGRVVVAAMSAGIIGTAFVIIGERVAFGGRRHAVSQLLAVISLATSGATLAGGVLADSLGWRAAFLLPAAGLLVVALWLPSAVPVDRRPPGRATARDGARRVRAVLRERDARVMLGLGFLDGAALHGVVAFLPVAVAAGGSTATVAGATVSAVGVATLAATVLLRRVAARRSAPSLIAIGGGCLVAAYLVAAADQRALPVLGAAVLVGGGLASLHATFQAWATEVVPWARATATSLFGTGLLLGAAASTALLAPLADDGRYGALFAAAAGTAAVAAAAGAMLRRGFDARSAASGPPRGNHHTKYETARG